jgi:hypothetical protein
MKRPSAASLKRVTAENLVRLGPERLADILLEVAGTRVELKRRLRMELAAEQGAEHLLPEIDRRLQLLSTSRGAVSWRQRPAFVRDLDGVRGLIAGRLAELDRPAAQDRALAFLARAPSVARRVRDKEGAVDAVFARAAADAVTLHDTDADPGPPARLAAAIAEQPAAWGRWSAAAFGAEHVALARRLLAALAGPSGPAWGALRRRLADVAEDPDAYRAAFGSEALSLPGVAADIGARFLRAGRLEEARMTLEAAGPPAQASRGRGDVAPDFHWESVWIDYLDAAGQGEAAQAARWSAFERTLSVERARAFVRRLPDFEDVEAEQEVFEIAAAHPQADAALTLLMDWPVHREAAAFIHARGGDLRPDPELAEAWARKLRRRHPAAAEALLRRAAAEAFRRRALALATRLSEEADAIGEAGQGHGGQG